MVGAGPIFGFALDPVAEFAAAYRYAEESGAEREKWVLLENRIARLEKQPSGFLSALKITIRAYSIPLGWKPVEFFMKD